MKRGLLIIDRGSRQREASEELEVICEGIKAKGDYTFVDFSNAGIKSLLISVFTCAPS